VYSAHSVEQTTVIGKITKQAWSTQVGGGVVCGPTQRCSVEKCRRIIISLLVAFNDHTFIIFDFLFDFLFSFISVRARASKSLHR